jgi:hypothetical protein
VVLSREQRFALEHLGEDASRAPNVHLHIVFLPCKHNLRCAVVSCGNITSHLWVLYTSKAKVADLEIAVLVYKDVARLQVTVDYTGRVNVFQTALEESARVSTAEDLPHTRI